MHVEHYIESEGAKLFYGKTGRGSRALLLFHGFGQDHTVFAGWNESLAETYTLYAFDILFHGQSTWHSHETAITKEDWKKILQLFLKENNIERFSMAGFSMGGKFVLATLEVFSSRIDDIFLLAPDGIKTNFWYSLATYPVAFRKLFKSMIEKPNRFYAITRLAARAGLMDKGIIRFVESQMDTPEKRKRVYSSWVIFRHLKFNMQEIAGLINEHRIALTMIVGRFDKIITTENMETLLNKLHTPRLKILETGHNGIIAGSQGLIRPSAPL